MGERELFIDCEGEGEPTMVLEVGEANSADQLDALKDAYKSQLRVSSYDRANKGLSGTAPTPRTAKAVLSDLHGLLEAANVPAPYLLVGHSAGGLLVQAYAATYPDQVAGVVAINPVPPWQAWSTSGFQQMKGAERKAETDYFVGANGESLDYRDLSRHIADLPIPPDIPAHVLISTAAQCDSPRDICGRTYADYQKIMKGVARRWPQGRFSQVAAPQEIHLAKLDAIRQAIDDVIARSQAA